MSYLHKKHSKFLSLLHGKKEDTSEEYLSTNQAVVNRSGAPKSTGETISTMSPATTLTVPNLPSIPSRKKRTKQDYVVFKV